MSDGKAGFAKRGHANVGVARITREGAGTDKEREGRKNGVLTGFNLCCRIDGSVPEA
jgi:hypothetical protein